MNLTLKFLQIVKKPLVLTFLLSVPLAMIRFINILPISIINPFNYKWMQNEDGALLDLAQSNTAQTAFIFQENWNFQGQITNLGSNIGNVLLFSDANPLFAYLLKVFVWVAQVDRQPLQFVGIEILIAIAALIWSVMYFVFKETDKIAVAVLTSIICSFAPQVPLKVWAPSVMYQFVIVLSFILFRKPKSRRAIADIFLWGSLGFICAGINTYFVPMVFMVLIARIADESIVARNFGSFKLAIGFATGVLLGHFISGGFSAGFEGGKTGIAGVGPFSADLLSLIDSGGISRWWPDLPSVASFEGYSFLGSASIIIVSFTLLSLFIRFTKTKAIKNALVPRSGSYKTLLIVCFILYLFAVGPALQIRGVAHWITQDPSILEYFSIFHSSGRFVLPLLYFLILIPIIYLTKILDGRLIYTILICASMLQFFEFSSFNYGTHQRMLKITQVENLKVSAIFENELKKTKYLEFIPSSPTPDVAPWRSYILRFLAENGTVTNFAYMNRYDKKKIINVAIETNGRVLNSGLRSDYIYIISNEELVKVKQKYLLLNEFIGWKAIKILD